MIDLSYVEKSFEAGLRAIGPAHYGPGTYAFGTDSSGGLSRKGKELLMEMGRLGMILDVTHLCDESFWEAIELFRGPVWASHNNSRVLVPHNRQFSDDQIKILIRRKSVIGVALDAWMLAPGWEREKDTPASRNVTLFSVADHIDHFCQLAGNSEHVAIGSDLDGAFGKEQCPLDLETIEDLNRFPSILRQRGYSESDLANILCGNWIRFLENNWK
jgi:membrane dipeptidase